MLKITPEQLEAISMVTNLASVFLRNDLFVTPANVSREDLEREKKLRDAITTVQEFIVSVAPLPLTDTIVETVGPLYKSNIVIWSPYPGESVELEQLAKDATSGRSYCPTFKSLKIEVPENDSDWDGTEFFHGQI